MRLVFVGLFFLLAAPAAQADTCSHWVSTTGIASGSGDESNPWTLTHANGQLTAGDVACLAEGTYSTSERINPSNSGTSGSPIVYQPDPDNTNDVILQRHKCVAIIEEDWIVVREMVCEIEEVANSYGIELRGASFNTIEDNTVRRAVSRGILLRGLTNSPYTGSNYNVVRGNLIEDIGAQDAGTPGCDSPEVDDDWGTGTPNAGDGLNVERNSNFNLIENNTIRNTNHLAIRVRAAGGNIVRGNHVRSPREISVTLTYDVGSDPSGFDAEYNVVEGNLIEDHGDWFNVEYCEDSDFTPQNAAWAGLGIVLHTTDQIVRKNRLVSGGPANSIHFAGSNPQWPDISRNYVYHNTVVDGDGPALDMKGDSIPTGGSMEDNVVVNNAFVGNKAVDGDPQSPPDDTQVWLDMSTGKEVEFRSNQILASLPGDETIFNTYFTETTLDELQATSPTPSVDWFEINVEKEHPRFVNRTAEDLRLMDGSPLIDAGDFLTTVTSDECDDIGGGETDIHVEDSNFFSEGISHATYTTPADTDADVVQLEGSTTELTITAIDRTNHVLTVDATVTCDEGDGLALAYDGDAPDIGYHEGGATVTEFTSDGDDDGFIHEDANVRGVGTWAKSVSSGADALRVGDKPEGSVDIGIRSVLSFDTSSLPSNAVLEGAFVEITTSGVLGDPAGVGDFVVELADGDFHDSTDLQKEDWEATAAVIGAAVPFQSTTSGTVWRIDLGTIVGALDEIQPDGWTQIRLRLDATDDDDGNTDYLKFYSGENSDAAKRPKLRVVYSTP